eukprot:CAMPEP_0117806336 /NCGR_PEP_ID=MMETSP0948-20121206/18496_1 /TAXON_ID=44440 /ORGANISM="Chattonella subsalsa, Strain CCMP2191" /LENGTH=152 /DNA_ID=CAMNT_0005640769 /DNA_START=377 /DNA_END=836 /DNA_ORIENTATION=-
MVISSGERCSSVTRDDTTSSFFCFLSVLKEFLVCLKDFSELWHKGVSSEAVGHLDGNVAQGCHSLIGHFELASLVLGQPQERHRAVVQRGVVALLGQSIQHPQDILGHQVGAHGRGLGQKMDDDGANTVGLGVVRLGPVHQGGDTGHYPLLD